MEYRKKTPLERKDLILKMAYYILNTHASIRSTASVFNIPNTTLEYMLKVDLKIIDINLYNKLCKVWELNSKRSIGVANMVQINKKEKTKFLIKDFILKKVVDTPKDMWIEINMTDIAKEINYSRTRVCELLLELLKEPDCEFERKTEHNGKKVVQLYKIKE